MNQKTTDNQKELFDTVDENDQVVGKATRGEVHKNKNLIHRSVGVVIFNSKGEMFLHQRSSTKDTDPNKWTIACSGHVSRKVKSQKSKVKSANQKLKIYESTAHRELIEELGVNLNIEPVCKYLCRAPKETEMVKLFKSTYNGLFKLNKEEITQGKFFTQKELKEAILKHKIELSYMGRVALGKIGWI